MSGRHLLYSIPVVVFLAVAVYFAVGLTRDPQILPSTLIDKPAPAFDLPPIEGTTKGGLRTADLNGRVALVNFFASWCAPCRVEHPFLMRMAEKEGVTIYGVNYKDKPEDALAWLAELGNPFARIGADRDGRVAIDWGVYGIPETFVVDAGGRIRFKHVGPIDARAMKEKILPVIAELEKQ